MVSRNAAFGAYAVLALATLGLAGCGAKPEITAENEKLPASDVGSPEPSPIEQLVNSPGTGTLVAFPANNPPSYKDPVPGADLFKVYGAFFYRYSGDDTTPTKTNVSVPVDIATALEGKQARD
jgi:hypothetical protein